MAMNGFDFSGKTVLLTGGSEGIGPGTLRLEFNTPAPKGSAL